MSEKKDDYKQKYKEIETIGSGSSSTVSKGKNNKSKKLVSIKKIFFEKQSFLYQQLDSEQQKEKFINDCKEEFDNMKKCSKNNINSVECDDEYFISENNDFIIIMEYCDSNLLKLLQQKKKFEINEIVEIMRQLNKAFKIMRSNNIIHRDLKLENILIKYNDKEKKSFTVKLADYGFSKKVESLSKIKLNSHLGTLYYMAPQILNNENYNYKCDLWSVGIILYQLFFNKFPFTADTESALITQINDLGKSLKKTEEKDLDDLIQKLLQKNEESRLTWEEYFNHQFFKNKYLNLIYITISDNIEIKIFGKKFVESNKNNIQLINIIEFTIFI